MCGQHQSNARATDSATSVLAVLPFKDRGGTKKFLSTFRFNWHILYKVVAVLVLRMGKWLSQLPGLCLPEEMTPGMSMEGVQMSHPRWDRRRLSPSSEPGGTEAHLSFPGHVAGLLWKLQGLTQLGHCPQAPAWPAHRSM